MEYDFSRYHARATEGFAHVAWLRGDIATARLQWARASDLCPADLVDRSFVQRHLGGIDDHSTTCFRCSTVKRRH